MLASGRRPDVERPAAVRILVDLPQCRTYPKGCHRPPAFDAPSVHQARSSQVRRLFSSTPRPKTPGPKGPSAALIQAIVELKSRNPRFGCPDRADHLKTFGVAIDKNVVNQVLSKHYRPAPGGIGPPWLSFIGHARGSLWSVDLFRCESIVLRQLLGARGHGPVHAPPRRHRRALWCRHRRRPLLHVQRRHSRAGIHATSPCRSRSLFEAHRWTANLRILEIDEIKTVPHVPLHTHLWSA